MEDTTTVSMEAATPTEGNAEKGTVEKGRDGSNNPVIGSTKTALSPCSVGTSRESINEKMEQVDLKKMDESQSPRDEESKQGEEKVDMDSSHSFATETAPSHAEDDKPAEAKDDDPTNLKKQEDSAAAETPSTEVIESKEDDDNKKEEKDDAIIASPESKEETNSERGRPVATQSTRPPQQQQQQPPPPPRLVVHPHANSQASTEIVQSMFGPSVGNCFGDFSCQYNHVRGRLYASTEAVLFYSNIFGFEKKINLSYEHVLQMSLYRQTSIQVTVQDDASDEEVQYVFKAFSDRTKTLQLLIELWRQSQGVEGNLQLVVPDSTDNPQDSSDHLVVTPSRSLSPPNNNSNGRPASILKQPPKATTPPTPSVSPSRGVDSTFSSSLFPDLAAASRKRSKSVPNLHRRRSKERSNSLGSVDDNDSTSGSSNLGASGNLPVDDDFDWNATPTKSDQAAWEVAKQSAGSWVKEVGVKPVTLQCSLSTFYKLFLANHAEYSIDEYQRGEEVKDLDVKVTPWAQQQDGANAMTRTIDFKHPCASFGVGPSHAPTTKKQKLWRYPGYGICMASFTTVEGLPGADCFVVEDIWLIEVLQNGSNSPQVTFSTRFGANFTKRTFLKSIIQKNIKTGTKEWFVGYKKMIQSALKDNLHLDQVVEAPPSDNLSVENEQDAARKDVSHNDLLHQLSSMDGRVVLVAVMASQVFLVLLLVFVVSELRMSHRATEGLLQEMKLLRLEHGQVLSLLLEGQGQQLEEGQP